jgi:RNA polymerase sigma-70 factor (ECF subfamily)
MGAFSLAIGAQQLEMNALPGFDQIYESHWNTVYKTALRVTGNPADAEDAMQTVFLRIWKREEPLEEMASPDRYFRRAATNAALDILRRKAAKNEFQLDSTLMHAAPDSSPVLKHRLREAIAQLRPRDAEMFTLRYVEGLSNGEIGALYKMTRGRVAVHLFRIRHLLRNQMEK